MTLVLLLVFAAALLGIGLWGMRRTGSAEDYLLAGRGIGPWIAALSFGTSYFSGVLFIGFAGKLGWGFGLDVLWIALGNTLFGALLAWLVLGGRTRRMTHNLQAMTMPEFFGARYGSATMKIVAAAIIFIFLLPYSASVFKGLGHLFEVNFGLSYEISVLLLTLLAGAYLILGGYHATSRIDFIQGLIMIVGTLVMVIVLVGKGGGVAAVVEAVRADHGPMVAGRDPVMYWLMLGSLAFMTSFGTWGLPQMTQKFYAIRDESMIRKGAIVTALFSLVVVFGAYFTGALSHVDSLLPGGPPTVEGKIAFDRIMPTLLSSNLPDALMALILLLILSASLSTLASLILVSSSAVAIDIYKVHIRHEATPGKPVRLMRILTGVFVLASFLLAIVAERRLQVIITLMSLSWGTVAGSFMAPYLYGLYWKGTTRIGAFAGMLAGLFTALGFFFVYGPALFPLGATLAMLAPFVVVPLVGLFTTPPAPALVETAFGPLRKDEETPPAS
jgi:solute:Na+ symporter, SSS family